MPRKERNRQGLFPIESQERLPRRRRRSLNNYGELMGISEARKFFAGYIGLMPGEMTVVGSLALYDTICTARLDDSSAP